MKRVFSILILCTVISPIYAGVEEQAIKNIIALFKTIITSDFQAEVSNAEQKLDKSNPKDAINHLLIAGLHLKTGNTIVHWGDARESYAKNEQPRQILALMITDILESNEKSNFLDDSTVATLKQSQKEILV